MSSVINTRVVQTPVDELQRHPQNPRRGNVDVIADSIRANGFYGVVVAQKSTGHVLAGNHRLEGAKLAGLKKVPTAWVDVDDEAALRILLADNRTSDIATSDEDALAEILQGLLVTDDGLAGTAYETSDLDDLLASLRRSAADSEPGGDEEPPLDKAEELLDTWGVRKGDVWTAGDQTIIVGDSTDGATWKHVTRSVDALITSPPYAQQRNYTKEIGDWCGLMEGVFTQAAAAMAADGQMLVNLGLVHRDRKVIRYWDPWLEMMEGAGWPLFGWYVWDQGFGLPGNWHEQGRLGPSHEFVFHLLKAPRVTNKTKACANAGQERRDANIMRNPDGEKVKASGSLTINDTKVPDSVVRVTRQQGAIEAGDHPAVFPPSFPRELIEAYTQPGECVLDPFLGSGSTLLAAHAAGRAGIGIEYAPKYAAVALERLRLAGLELERHRA